MADDYTGFEVIEAPARDDYSGFEIIEDAEDRKLAAETRREMELQRQSGGDIGELGYIQDTANRTGRAAVRGTGLIRRGLSETAKSVMEPVFRAIGGEEMVERQRANARAIQRATRPEGTADISQDERFRRAASSIRIDPSRDDTATAAVAEFAGTVAPVMATGPIAPFTAGLQMGGGSLEASEAAGLSPEEAHRRFLINTAGGTALGFAPIPFVNRAGAYIDGVTSGLQREGQRQLLRRAGGQLLRRGARVGVGGVSGSAVNTAGDIVLQLAENETLDPSTLDTERLRQNATAGFGAGAGVGLFSRPSITRALTPEAQLELQGPPTPARASYEAMVAEEARLARLRQSPEGARLLAEQLEEEAALARNVAEAPIRARNARNREIVENIRGDEEAQIELGMDRVSDRDQQLRREDINELDQQGRRRSSGRAEQVFQTFIDAENAPAEAAAREAALRQSPEGARLLAEQLDEQAAIGRQQQARQDLIELERATAPQIDYPRSPAHEAALAIRDGINARERAAADAQTEMELAQQNAQRELAAADEINRRLRQSPEGAQLLRDQLRGEAAGPQLYRPDSPAREAAIAMLSEMQAREQAAADAAAQVRDAQQRAARAEAEAATLSDRLRQSPEGLRLLAEQLDQERATAVDRGLLDLDVDPARAPVLDYPPGPARQVFENMEALEAERRQAQLDAQAQREQEIYEAQRVNQSPVGAEGLRRRLEQEGAQVSDEARLRRAAELDAAAARDAVARRAEVDQFGDQRTARNRDQTIAERQAQAEAEAVARRRAADEFAAQRGGPALEPPARPELAPGPGQLELDIGDTTTTPPTGRRGRSGKLNMRSKRGSIDPEILLDPRTRALLGGLTGGVIGFSQGDTAEERARNALIGAGIGVGGGLALSRRLAGAVGSAAARRRGRALPDDARITVREYVGRDGQPARAIQIELPSADGATAESFSPEQLAAQGYQIPDFEGVPEGVYRPPGARPRETETSTQQGESNAAQEGTGQENDPGQYQETDTRGVSEETVGGDSDAEGGQTEGAPEGEVAPSGSTPFPQDINFELPEQPGFAEKIRRGFAEAQRMIKTPFTAAGKALGIVGKPADYLVGTVSTRLRNIAQEVYGAGKRYNQRVKENSARLKMEVIPFLTSAREIIGMGGDRVRMTVFLSNGQFDKAAELLADRSQRRANAEIQYALSRLPADATPEIRQQLAEGIRTNHNNQLNTALENFSRAQAAFKDILDTARAAGIDTGELDNYWHRALDPKKKKDFLKLIGRDDGPITTAVKEHAKKLGMDAENLSDDVYADIANQVLRGQASPDGALPSQFKARGIKNIQELADFYLPYDESAMKYIDSSVRAVERRKLFGRAEDGIKGSLGHAIERARRDHGLSSDDEVAIKSMVHSLFNNGEKPPNAVFRLMRDAIHAAYLGQLLDTSTQMADYVLPGARYGLQDASEAIRKPYETTIKEMGIIQPGEEFTNRDFATKALSKLFTSLGFKKVVDSAQDFQINTSMHSLRRKANTPKGLREIQAKYRRVMGDEYGQFIDDLQNGRSTENTRLAGYIEISDLQPVDLMEMPQPYLDNPNGRIMYTLRTFTIKQIDALRKDGFGQMLEGRENFKAGNKQLGKEQMIRGGRNLVALAAAYTLGGAGVDAVKDLITGRDIKLDDYAVTGLLRLAGMNRYDYFNYQRNGLGSVLRDKIMPPVGLLDEATQFVRKGDQRIVQRVPYIGDILFERFTEAGAKRRASDRARRATEQRKASMSEIEKRAAERRKAEAAKRKSQRLLIEDRHHR